MRVIGVLVAVALSSSVAHADAVDNTKEADALFLKGRDALAAGDFVKACELFFDAQERQRENPAILINLGLCNEKQDKVASALRWYRKTQLMTQGKTDATFKEYAETARDQVNALQDKVSKVTFALGSVQADAELLIDGQTISKQELIVEVDKGPHVIEARRPGMVTSRDSLDVPDNGKNLTFTFRALLPVPEPSRGRRRLIGAAVGGGVIVVGSVVSGIWARSIKNDFECSTCADEAARDKEYAKEQRPPTIVWASSVAVGVGIAAYFFFTKPTAETPTTAFVPTVSNDGAGFAMFRRF